MSLKIKKIGLTLIGVILPIILFWCSDYYHWPSILTIILIVAVAIVIQFGFGWLAYQNFRKQHDSSHS